MALTLSVTTYRTSNRDESVKRASNSHVPSEISLLSPLGKEVSRTPSHQNSTLATRSAHFTNVLANLVVIVKKSSFESVLGTNYIPSDQECKLIQGYLVESELALDADRKRMAELGAMLQDLRIKIDSTQASVNAHRTMISLSRRLPDDILGEIFHHCLPTTHNATLCPFDAPVLLTHVCQRWRQTAFSIPRLWSSLHVPLVPGHSVQENLEKAVLEWRRRAATIPMSISFPLDDELKNVWANLDCLARLLDPKASITPSFPGLDSLVVSLVGPEEVPISTFLKGQLHQAATVRHLKRLHLYIGVIPPFVNVPGTEPEEVYPRILQSMDLPSAKYLRELHLNLYSGDGWEVPLLSSFFPCSQLEILDLQARVDSWTRISNFSITSDVVVDILRHCPKLVVFNADIDAQEDTDPTPSQQTPNPAAIVSSPLKFLGLSYYDFDDTVPGIEWIDFCELPQVTSIRIRRRDGDAEGDPSPVIFTLTEKVRNRLTSLSLGSFTLTPGGLIRLLSSLPLLGQLHLEREWYAGDDDDLFSTCQYKDRVVERLTPRDGTTSSHLCPRLQHLKWEKNTYFTDQALANMILKRATSPLSPVPLKQVHIDFGRPASTTCDHLAPLWLKADST
ncbi:hypothetical protein NMY22_g11948 [Coprinellus aureogranulatus]|nr:hypothetical protein NMY22_g11948 [Coprinellus aureogranulatus]